MEFRERSESEPIKPIDSPDAGLPRIVVPDIEYESVIDKSEGLSNCYDHVPAVGAIVSMENHDKGNRIRVQVVEVGPYPHAVKVKILKL